MNWDIFEGNWKQLKGSAQANWGKLTDDDADVIAGNREALIGKLQEHYGYARDEAEREVDAWAEEVKEKI
ncbi:MAG: CsbD family protein [Pseudomonadota bacterium]